jgi:hypothetical protein
MIKSALQPFLSFPVVANDDLSPVHQGFSLSLTPAEAKVAISL